VETTSGASSFGDFLFAINRYYYIRNEVSSPHCRARSITETTRIQPTSYSQRQSPEATYSLSSVPKSLKNTPKPPQGTRPSPQGSQDTTADGYSQPSLLMGQCSFLAPK
jgi:hypothetical protein